LAIRDGVDLSRLRQEMQFIPQVNLQPEDDLIEGHDNEELEDSLDEVEENEQPLPEPIGIEVTMDGSNITKRGGRYVTVGTRKLALMHINKNVVVKIFEQADPTFANWGTFNTFTVAHPEVNAYVTSNIIASLINKATLNNKEINQAAILELMAAINYKTSVADVAVTRAIVLYVFELVLTTLATAKEINDSNLISVINDAKHDKIRERNRGFFSRLFRPLRNLVNAIFGKKYEIPDLLSAGSHIEA